MSMNMNKWLLAGLLGFSVHASALEALQDGDLSDVSGQQGIAIGLEYGVNTDANGAPLASLGNCSAAGASPCRFAWKIAQRNASGGEWTVFKDSYMSLKIPALNIGVKPTMGSVASNTGYFDLTRFQSETGTCLLPVTCDTAGINSLPAMWLFYPAVTVGYNTATGVSSGYTSVQFGMTIGRMSMEYGATGYNSNAATGSFLSAKIADNNNANFAGIAFQGNALIYGF